MRASEILKQSRNAPDILDKISPDEIDEFKTLAKKSIRRVRGVPLIAKGDSWFDYLPGTDIIDCLRARHDCEIVNFAQAGDTLENMILGNGVDADGMPLAPGVRQALREINKIKPKIFLFSGGGNDVAGDGFITYLNHHDAGALDFLRENVANEMILGVFRGYLVNLIKSVKAAHEGTFMVMHGYAYAEPTGKGVSFFGFRFSGPWLLPGLRQKAISEEEGKVLVRRLIDKYNNMLSGLEAEYSNFKYVDLRGQINPEDWRDELHLRNSAYAKVAAHIFATIRTLNYKTLR